MNSGFGPGAPRNEVYRPVGEGREKGVFLPKLRAVGRIGKAPFQVPAAVARASASGRKPGPQDKGEQLPIEMALLLEQLFDTEAWIMRLEQNIASGGLLARVGYEQDLQAIGARFTALQFDTFQFMRLLNSDSLDGNAEVIWGLIPDSEQRLKKISRDLSKFEAGCKRLERRARESAPVEGRSGFHIRHLDWLLRTRGRRSLLAFAPARLMVILATTTASNEYLSKSFSDHTDWLEA